MNFKLKALFAAVALAASATSANAAISGTGTLGNSELVFSAWDTSTGIGYTYDLLSALTLTNFIGADAAANTAGNVTMLNNAVINTSLITGPNGQIFDGALTGIPFGANIANVQWNLTAIDNAGRTRFLTTKDGNANEANFSTSNQAKQTVTIFDAYYGQSDSFAVALVDDTYALTNDTNGAAYAGNSGNNANGAFFDNTNALGSSSFMYLLAQATLASSNTPSLFKQLATADGSALVASTYQQGGAWRLNLSVAAVPEPETYAMFLAGLGIMGAVARRRKGQVK